MQGRVSRYRTADDVESIVRTLARQGISDCFITDDNFARNRNWEPILDRLIELREAGLRVDFVIQVDTLCHRIPGFIEKASLAGVKSVFIGIESINPASLKAAGKGQNRITEYRSMLLAWRRARVVTFGGYILGFPSDTPQSIARDISIIKRELPIDIIEFSIMTPLPGSQDHKVLLDKGEKLDSDLNAYDSAHVVNDHPSMSRSALQAAYHRAWDDFYSWDHILTLLSRSIVTHRKTATLAALICQYYGTHRYEAIHPLQGGLLRRRVAASKRGSTTAPLLSSLKWRFKSAKSAFGLGLFYLRLQRVRRRLQKRLSRSGYADTAIEATDLGEPENLQLYESPQARRELARHTQRVQMLKRLDEKRDALPR